LRYNRNGSGYKFNATVPVIYAGMELAVIVEVVLAVELVLAAELT
jgi:hypothetical protein